MANKATRVLDNMNTNDREVVLEEMGNIDEKATPLKQARYINELLDFAGKSGIHMQDTMRKCGKSCISNNAIKIAKKMYQKSTSMEEFLAKLNEADIGGKNLHINNGRIIAIYKKCYCNIPKKVESMNLQYCQCSAGWYQTLFSEVFGKRVKVNIIDTITNGAEECTFEITT